MSLLEAQRQLLEENDALEVAISKRFRKVPALAENCSLNREHQLTKKRRRTHKEMLLLEHELKFFDETYKGNKLRLREQLDLKSDLSKQIQSFKDPDMKFFLFLDALEDINSKRPTQLESAKSALSFALPYLSAPEESKKPDSNKVKRKHILSSMGAHIDQDLNTLFNEVEQYGKFLDMSYFFDQYKLIVPSKATYVEYLRTFASFDEKAKASTEYLKYLDQLHEYLLRFYTNTYPLTGVSKALQKESSLESTENGKAKEAKDGESKDGEAKAEEPKAEENELFCKACDKLFAKETVYKGHLDGKKHKKNQKLLDEKAPPAKAPDHRRVESQIAKLAELLKPTIEDTINHIERRAAASERERMIEDRANEQEESDFTAVDTDSSGASGSEDDDDDDLLSKHLPLGTDGTPIPLWLYKLQGLHRSYNCEICGNIKYKGRQQFDKHFNLAKHVYGLQCLGVDDEAMLSFAGISSIEEANQLWQRLKQARRSQEKTIENAVEVEDEEGNVMPEKDYLELKRQGLL